MPRVLLLPKFLGGEECLVNNMATYLISSDFVAYVPSSLLSHWIPILKKRGLAISKKCNLKALDKTL